MSDKFKFFPHPHIAVRKAAGPPKVSDVIAQPATAPWYYAIQRLVRREDH